MVVSTLKSLWSFLSAVILLALLVCAAEVGVRGYRVYRACPSHPKPAVEETLAELICRPSRTTFLEPIPGRRLMRVHPDTGRDVEVRLNDFGMRAVVPTIPKPPEIFRVLVLGDETMLGADVLAEETMTARLQEFLQQRANRPIEILNAGIPEGCPLQAALSLRHSLLGLQPDLVVHHFDMSDVADDYSMRTFVLMGKERSPRCAIHPSLQEARNDVARSLRQEFALAQVAESQLAEIWARRSSPRTRSDLGDPLNRYRWLEDSPPDWSIPISQAIEALGDVRHSLPPETPYVVITCPKPWQVSESACPSVRVRTAEGVKPRAVYTSPRPFETLSGFCREAKIPLVRCDDLFLRQAEPELLFLQNSAGLSEAGHALYAEQVAMFLLRNVAGPWGAAPGGPTRRDVIGAQYSEPAGP